MVREKMSVIRYLDDDRNIKFDSTDLVYEYQQYQEATADDDDEDEEEPEPEQYDDDN